MLTIYPACFFKEESGMYSVLFPDLNHLATCGDTLDDAMAMAVDCLAGYIYTERMDGEELPKPSEVSAIDLEAISAEYDAQPLEKFVNLVSVDVDEYAKAHFNKSVKKTLTIPDWLNAAALKEHINFSRVLQDGLKRELGIA